MSAAIPLDDESFAGLMAPLGPFERHPRLAVAVSGGADSMAMTLLAARWAAARAGTLLGLTVDHQLRDGSAAEAAQVGRWLAARGIAHTVLPWTGLKPATGIQAAARTARYTLLLNRCREDGIAHLLLAHHQDDQAETVLLRLAGGSRAEGLAGMAPLTATPSARLLRPLLAVPKARLEATLQAIGQPWISDPSNRNEAFMRVRLRKLAPALAEAGMTADELAARASQAASARATIDRTEAALLARAAVVTPAGYARVDATILAGAPEAIGLRAFGHVLRAIGGGAYTARNERLERLWAEVRDGLSKRRSLGGCLIAPWRGNLLIQREPAAMAPAIAAQAGDTIHWDGRFLVRLGGQGMGQIGPLGQAGWLAIKPEAGSPTLPAAVMATVPALWGADAQPLAVPHLGWRRRDYSGPIVMACVFAPTSPLTGGLVWHDAGTMC